jgi:hypothetical protein
MALIPKQCARLKRDIFARKYANMHTRVVDEISLSRNFAKYFFRISRNNFFISRNFAKFHIAKYCEISRNIAKFF